MQSVVIAPDSYVTIRYTLFEDGSNTPIEVAEDGAEVTVSYVHGYAQVLPALERGLEGLAAGAHATVVAEPDDAFGTYEADGLFELDKADLEGSETLEVGEEFVASGPDGDVVLRVVEIGEDVLKVDSNHPLAGKKVRFEVDVVEVRAATEEEIEQAEDDLTHDHGDACGCGEVHAPDPSLLQIRAPGRAPS